MKRKIVILGDSIVMPRPWIGEADKTEYEDTYGCLLSRAFGDDISVCFVGGLDTETALQGWNEQYVAYKRPDIVIYHLGINDCVQRVFRKNSSSIHLKPWFRKLTRNFGIRLVNRYRQLFIRLVGRKNQYVKADAFRKNLELLAGQVRAFSEKCRFVAIGICEKPEWQERRSPGDNQLIKQYNSILQKEFGTAFVDPNRFGRADEILISDGIHFTRQTHERVAEELKQLLG